MTIKNTINSFLLLAIFPALLFHSCVSIEKIKTGEQAIERKQYAIAQILLEEELSESRGEIKARKAYLLGEAYRLTRQIENALKWYLASQKTGFTSDLVIYKTGLMYKQSGKYNEAILQFEKVADTSPVGTDASREKDICRQALDWIEEKHEFEAQDIENPESSSLFLNSRHPDGRLVVTSDHKTNFAKKYKWTGRYFSDIYFLDPSNPLDFESVDGKENNSLNRGSASFNSQGTQMIFSMCTGDRPDENYCKLYSSELVQGNWSNPVILPFIKAGINYSHPFIFRDSILFFSANAPSGKGGYDIYFSRRQNMRWLGPVLLPGRINTPGNENFPTAIEDSLYFSSDYHPGMGGLDIFKIYIMKDGRWSAPENMKMPVNSPKDDFCYIQNSLDSDIIAYFSSSRDNLGGKDNIYSLREKKSSSSEVATTVTVKNDKNYKLFLSLKVVEKVYTDPEDPNSRVIGKRPIPGVQGLFINSGQEFKGRNDGRYIRHIAFDSTYRIQLFKGGYLQKTIEIPPSSLPTDPDSQENISLSVEVELVKPYFEKEIVLKNIYYDLDKWFIREDAKPTLDQLYADLADNPNLNVLIAAHTDCRADDVYNMELSEKRARSVVDYLIEKGIKKERLSLKGYGKSRLIEKCPCESCTEKQHQKNRRTTFTLLGSG